MDTSAAVANPQKVAPRAPMSWDDYFPLINKGILFLILGLAVLFVSGIDLVQMSSRLWSPDAESVSVASAGTSASLASKFQGMSFSITGPGGWKVAVGLVVVLGCVVAVALGFLAASGRDAIWTKEQQAKAKADQKANLGGNKTSGESESTECNLTSYKLFFAPKEEPATAAEVPASVTS